MGKSQTNATSVIMQYSTEHDGGVQRPFSETEKCISFGRCRLPLSWLPTAGKETVGAVRPQHIYIAQEFKPFLSFLLKFAAK